MIVTQYTVGNKEKLIMYSTYSFIQILSVDIICLYSM